MAKQMFIEIKKKETKRAWASAETASSSGINNPFQESPEQLDDDQMEMANIQALQQTAEQASMSVAKAI
eukprot:1340222-Heterocapsa_arctica.AAC.1